MAPQPEESAPTRVLTEELVEFSARAGHDLLGPLNQSAALLTLFVRRYRNELDSEADVLLEHLGNAATRMETVAAGVRRYLEMASRPVANRPVELNRALSSALAILDPSVKASGATVTADPLPSVECGGEQMTAMLEILIDNAIKFRRPVEAPRIHVSAARSGDDVLISVADNGIGIEPQHCEDVFLPFKRLNGREYPGAGLGLATAKLIARMQGGALRVDSVPGVGTTVTITLPGR